MFREETIFLHKEYQRYLFQIEPFGSRGIKISKNRTVPGVIKIKFHNTLTHCKIRIQFELDLSKSFHTLRHNDHLGTQTCTIVLECASMLHYFRICESLSIVCVCNLYAVLAVNLNIFIRTDVSVNVNQGININFCKHVVKTKFL